MCCFSSLYNKYSSELFIEWLRHYARDCCTNLYSAFTKVKILAFLCNIGPLAYSVQNEMGNYLNLIRLCDVKYVSSPVKQLVSSIKTSMYSQMIILCVFIAVRWHPPILLNFTNKEIFSERYNMVKRLFVLFCKIGLLQWLIHSFIKLFIRPIT